MNKKTIPCPPNNRRSPFYTRSNFCESDFCNYGNWHPDCICCTPPPVSYPNTYPALNPCNKNPIGCWVCPQENKQQVMTTYSCRKITLTPTNNWNININDLVNFENLNPLISWTKYPTEADCNANSGCKRKQNRPRYSW